jgi:hypothetical protein
VLPPAGCHALLAGSLWPLAPQAVLLGSYAAAHHTSLTLNICYSAQLVYLAEHSIQF